MWPGLAPSLQSRSEGCRLVRQEAGGQGGGQELLSAAPSTPPCITPHIDRAG